jgi:hypothetical protein
MLLRQRLIGSDHTSSEGLTMLIAVLIAGFAIISIQLNALRILLVDQIKQMLILNMMVRQIEGIDASFVNADAQHEIDIASGR